MTDSATSPTIFGPEFDVAQHNNAGNDDDDLDWLDDEGVGEAAAAARAAENAQPGSDVPPQQTGQEAQPVSTEQQPVAAEQQQPAQGQAQTTPEQQPTQQAPSQPDPDNPLAGTQFKDVAAVLKSYNELRSTYNRTLAEKQRDALEKAQLQAQLEQLSQPQPEALTPEQAQALLSDPRQLQEYITRQVQAGVQQTTQQVQQQQLQTEIQSVAERFMAKHPDVLPESPVDQQMGEVIEFFQTDREGNRSYDLFPVTDQNLEVAYSLGTDPTLFQTVKDLDLVPSEENLAIAREANEKPAFKALLMANPSAVDTDEGLEAVRQLAALPGVYQQAQQAAQPPTPEQVRQAAFVETGGTGAPLASAPGQVPAKDEFDEDVEFWEKNQGGNIFGLQVLGN